MMICEIYIFCIKTATFTYLLLRFYSWLVLDVAVREVETPVHRPVTPLLGEDSHHKNTRFDLYNIIMTLHLSSMTLLERSRCVRTV